MPSFDKCDVTAVKELNARYLKKIFDAEAKERERKLFRLSWKMVKAFLR